MAVAGGRARPDVPSALAAARPGAAGKRKRSAWAAADGSKRWGEAFFLLLYAPLWLALCLLVVPFKLYQRFTELEHLVITVGMVSAVPAFLVPLFLVGKADSIRSLKDRYWVKANVWIIIFSYVSNYVLTHYFFIVHGASYTFPSWRINNNGLGTVHFQTRVLLFFLFAPYGFVLGFFVRNLNRRVSVFFRGNHRRFAFMSWGLLVQSEINQNIYLVQSATDGTIPGPFCNFKTVPHATFLLTHACFLFYHMTSNITLRILRHSTANLPVSLRWLFEAAWILALAYFIAYLETLVIANFPYYEFIDRDVMYTVGSFLVSFPMFSRIDEKAEKWSLSRVAVDALGATTLVAIILDLWSIFLGPINGARPCVKTVWPAMSRMVPGAERKHLIL